MIAIGNDHAAFPEFKKDILAYLDEQGIAYKDFGCYEGEKCDYPDAAKKACAAVLSGECDSAILICGTGIGISMSANKLHGIRAAACSDYFSAKYTRLHNNANALCLGSRVIGSGLACELIDVFLHTSFEGGRHADRVAKIHQLETGC